MKVVYISSSTSTRVKTRGKATVIRNLVAMTFMAGKRKRETNTVTKKKEDEKHCTHVPRTAFTVMGTIKAALRINCAVVYWFVGQLIAMIICDNNLTRKILDANVAAERHQSMMVHMQSSDLALLLSQYKEYGVQKFSDFAHIV